MFRLNTFYDIKMLEGVDFSVDLYLFKMVLIIKHIFFLAKFNTEIFIRYNILYYIYNFITF